MARRAIVSLLALAALAAPATAAAAPSTVARDSGKLRLDDLSGATNDLVVTETATDVVFEDTAGLTAGAYCVQNGATRVVCAKHFSITGLLLFLGGGDDTARNDTTLGEEAYGGAGNDTITGGSADDVLTGSEDADTLNGRGGENFLFGSFGDDTLVSDPAGQDNMRGDSGADQISYSDRNGPVTVRLNGSGDNGQPGEGDVLWPDLERIVGTPYADTLVATSAAQAVRIDAGAGDDYLQGGPFGDDLNGEAGRDRVSYSDRSQPVVATLDDNPDGVAGENDAVTRDVESLRGGSGNDKLYGNGIAGNTLDGLGGDDLLEPKIGAGDRVIGGSGSDTVSYQYVTVAVTVKLDGHANDGVPGDAHLVYPDVENAFGGHGNDTLIGNAGPNRMNGYRGDDYLDGGAGTDDLSGFLGVDRVTYELAPGPVTLSLDNQPNDGAPGEADNVHSDVETIRGSNYADTLTGNSLANTLKGMGGNDLLKPLGGADVAEAGEGDDSILVDDGVADSVLCGGGTDTVDRDQFDSLNANCENADAL